MAGLFVIVNDGLIVRVQGFLASARIAETPGSKLQGRAVQEGQLGNLVVANRTAIAAKDVQCHGRTTIVVSVVVRDGSLATPCTIDANDRHFVSVFNFQ